MGTSEMRLLVERTEAPLGSGVETSGELPLVTAGESSEQAQSDSNIAAQSVIERMSFIDFIGVCRLLNFLA